MKPSKSPGRNTFQRNNYIQRCQDEGKEPSPEYLALYDAADRLEADWVESTDHEHDMEWDLRTTEWILDKVRSSDVYAQNLYAAICNNEFQKLDVFPILADKTCSYSWRYAGGIIADMQQKGDYIDWYCSGIRNSATLDDESYNALTKEEQEEYLRLQNYVAESVVTEEIEQDLLKLGWKVIYTDDE
jgi:hypothetical protein